MKKGRLRFIIVIIFILFFSSIGSGFSVEIKNIEGKTDIDDSAPTVLLTGFGPFLQYDVNPSQLIVENLSGQVVNGATIVGLILPVNYTESVEVITQAIEDYDPILVVSTGLAPGSHMIRVEKVGINIRFDGNWSNLSKLDPCGPLFRISQFPTYCIAKSMRRAGIPARTSFRAGFYICNAVLYGTLDYIKENDLQIKSGFIHVPFLPSQGPNSLELEKMLNATTIAIQVCLNS